MSVATAETPMAAKRKQPEPEGQQGKGKRDDVAVKMDRLVVDKARLVASRKGITLAAYLSDLVRGAVEKDFSKAVREMEASN